MKFASLFLLHGKGGSPAGSVSQLQSVLQPKHPELQFTRPLLPHNDPQAPAERSVTFLEELAIPADALIVGVSLGGLVAAKLQEASRPELHVICISSPTWADGVSLTRFVARRLSVYSPNDEVIAGRTADWPSLAEARPLEWLSHDTDRHKEALGAIISEYIEREAAKKS